MTRQWFEAFDHDFNTGTGRVVLKKAHFEGDYALEVGQQILLVCIEETDDYHDSFGTVVTVTGFKDAHNPDYFVVTTDLHTSTEPT